MKMHNLYCVPIKNETGEINYYDILRGKKYFIDFENLILEKELDYKYSLFCSYYNTFICFIIKDDIQIFQMLADDTHFLDKINLLKTNRIFPCKIKGRYINLLCDSSRYTPQYGYGGVLVRFYKNKFNYYYIQNNNINILLSYDESPHALYKKYFIFKDHVIKYNKDSTGQIVFNKILFSDFDVKDRQKKFFKNFSGYYTQDDIMTSINIDYYDIFTIYYNGKISYFHLKKEISGNISGDISGWANKKFWINEIMDILYIITENGNMYKCTFDIHNYTVNSELLYENVVIASNGLPPRIKKAK